MFNSIELMIERTWTNFPSILLPLNTTNNFDKYNLSFCRKCNVNVLVAICSNLHLESPLICINKYELFQQINLA